MQGHRDRTVGALARRRSSTPSIQLDSDEDKRARECTAGARQSDCAPNENGAERTVISDGRQAAVASFGRTAPTMRRSARSMTSMTGLVSGRATMLATADLEPAGQVSALTDLCPRCRKPSFQRCLARSRRSSSTRAGDVDRRTLPPALACRAPRENPRDRERSPSIAEAGVGQGLLRWEGRGPSRSTTVTIDVDCRAMLALMTFFDVLPPEPWDSPPPPEPPALPAWEGPPYGVVPGVVGLELLLAQTDRLAVYLPELIVYPDIVVLRLQLLGRRSPRQGIESGPGTWRFGVQFSDGTKVTSYGLGFDALRASTPNAGDGWIGKPSAAFLQPQDHRLIRGGTTWDLEYWLAPLPPLGAVTLACEWPNIEMGLTTATIEADAIRDAAGRVRDLWRTGF